MVTLKTLIQSCHEEANTWNPTDIQHFREIYDAMPDEDYCFPDGFILVKDNKHKEI